MIQEKQLKELFKYIEQKWDIAVEGSHKTDIKRIFGGVLCEDIMNDTLHEVKGEQPTFNPIVQAYESGKKIRRKKWMKGDWIKKHNETKIIDNTNYIYSVYPFSFIQQPEKWEIYTEPTEQTSSQVKLDNSFDKERFEAMFRASIGIGKFASFSDIILSVETSLQQLDAYYASKEGGENE